MATPSRSNAAATPKANLVATPTRRLASPRPGAGARPFAGKSPAVKTPASTHGHSHHMSNSSHPSSTPNAAAHLTDDLLALNSPAAALLSSLNDTRLTPLSGVHAGSNGLGISTMLEPQIAVPKDPETERLHRLQDVVASLKTRVAGAGITRVGVERLAHINGLALLPEEDNVTIAGNHCVDLEITFDHSDHDRVRTVILKINALGEEEYQKDASDILAEALAPQSQTGLEAPWKNLDAFAANLGYLSLMDRLSSTLNCFGAIKGLYATFRSIWAEEKKRLTWRNDIHQLCGGSAGMPTMDTNGRLGLAIKYWVEQRELSYNARPVSRHNVEPSPGKGIEWKAHVACDTGAPSITKSQQWLSPDILITPPVTEESGVSAGDAKPAWQNPTATKDNADAMLDIDTLLEPSNIRFVSTLDPPILLPLNAILTLNSEAQLVEVDQSLVGTYHHRLEQRSPTTQTASNGVSPRYTRNFSTFDRSGHLRKCTHAYTLYPMNTCWSYPVERLTFNHPKLIAEALPILRQYALLWSVLKRITSSEPAVPSDSDHASVLDSSKAQRSAVKVRSNRPQNKAANAAKLQAVLSYAPGQKEFLSIDVSLDLSNASSPRLDVIIPLDKEPYFAKMAIEIKANAEFRVTAVQGLSFAEPGEMDKKMTQIMKLSEDIGVLVVWVLEKVGHARE